MSPLATAPKRLRAQDMQLRTSYLADVLRTLYPQGEGQTELLVLPHARRPRLLVPAGSGHVAAAAVRHYSEPSSRRARLVRQLAATALRAGGATLGRHRVHVEPTGSVQQHLQQLLGEGVALSIHIGPARANRKPVLPLLAPSGGIQGFAKLGTGTLTRELVRGEASALATLARLNLRHVTPPAVRHAGQWGDRELLVQAPLPVWHRRVPLRAERLTAAMREVALCCGTTGGPLAASSYWRRLRRRVSLVSDQPEGAVLAAASAALGQHVGEVELQYGAWHGDWAPWNMAVLEDTLLLWDWERFSHGVPLGFDAVHFDLQQRLRSCPDAHRAVAATLAASDRLLAPFDVTPSGREVTALLYLVELAARYLTDRQAEAGARLGVLGTWLLPVLVRQIEELS